MKPIICTILAGCFLLGAVALHDYLTPVVGTIEVGEHHCLYTVSDGRIYISTPGAGGALFELDRQLNEVFNPPTVDKAK